MDFLKFLFCAGLVLLTGCSTLLNNHKNVYEQGYRQGVQEQIKQVAAQFQGGKFPYYHWTAPIVQDVRIPAHLANGMMIPEHNELVIIKPGQWTTRPAYPIQRQEKNNYENQISYLDLDVANITSLPKSVGPASQGDERSPKDEHHPAGMDESEE